MKKNILLILTLMLFSTSLSFAQRRPDRKQREKWLTEFKAKRTDFFSKRIDFTKKESKQFWPVYDELQMKKSQLHRELGKYRRRNSNNKNINYTEICDRMVDIKLREAILEKEYHEKFKQILPPEKLFKYYNTERAWAEWMLNDMRNRRKMRN